MKTAGRIGSSQLSTAARHGAAPVRLVKNVPVPVGTVREPARHRTKLAKMSVFTRRTGPGVEMWLRLNSAGAIVHFWRSRGHFVNTEVFWWHFVNWNMLNLLRHGANFFRQHFRPFICKSNTDVITHIMWSIPCTKSKETRLWSIIFQ